MSIEWLVETPLLVCANDSIAANKKMVVSCKRIFFKLYHSSGGALAALGQSHGQKALLAGSSEIV